jgi:hypothetical protein
MSRNVYAVRDALNFVRGPFMSGGEITARQRASAENLQGFSAVTHL